MTQMAAFQAYVWTLKRVNGALTILLPSAPVLVVVLSALWRSLAAAPQTFE